MSNPASIWRSANTPELTLGHTASLWMSLITKHAPLSFHALFRLPLYSRPLLSIMFQRLSLVFSTFTTSSSFNHLVNCRIQLWSSPSGHSPGARVPPKTTRLWWRWGPFSGDQPYWTWVFSLHKFSLCLVRIYLFLRAILSFWLVVGWRLISIFLLLPMAYSRLDLTLTILVEMTFYTYLCSPW